MNIRCYLALAVATALFATACGGGSSNPRGTGGMAGFDGGSSGNAGVDAGAGAGGVSGSDGGVAGDGGGMAGASGQAGAAEAGVSPSPTSIDPTFGAVDTTVSVTLTGSGFEQGMTVSLDASPPVQGSNVSVVPNTTATADFDLTGVAPGVYGLTAVNPSGGTGTLPAAFTVFQTHSITVSAIDPPFGCTCAGTPVTITSASGGFVSTPRVTMKLHDGSGSTIDLERVAFVDANTLTAVVPAGTPASSVPYDITVLEPPSDGGVGVLSNGFHVVPDAVPSIAAISPARALPGTTVDVRIFGQNFRDPVRVELLDRNLMPQATVMSLTPVSSTEIDTALSAPQTEGAYLLRVTDLDEMTSATFSDFIVGAVGPSGNLHQFVAAAPMTTGRRMLAGVTALDDLGNTYLYAIAGDTGAGGAPLASWERSQLGQFGQLGAWTDDGGANPLPHPLAGAAAVTVPVFDPKGSRFVPTKSYVYVTGGRDDGGVVRGDVERAEVLRAADAPTFTSSAGSAAAGTLASGTWYYQVSALLAAGDPDNPGGETLPSSEAIVTIGGTTGAIDLSWDPLTVNGAAVVSYRVYRSDAANGASHSEHLIATVTGTSYTDTGAAPGTQPPLAPGSLGVWVTDTHPLAQARWGHQMALVVDPSTGSRELYVVGGKSDSAAGYLGSVEVAPLDAQGHLSGGFTSSGTTAMTPRAFFSLAVETPANVSGYSGIARLFALGGDDGSALSLIEYSDVTTLASNSGWSNLGMPGTIGTRAGAMAVLAENAGERLWVMGGAGAATDTTFSSLLGYGRDLPFLSGDPALPGQSTAYSLLAPRALGVGLEGAGFLYFIGGTSDGSNALSTTEQSF